MEGGGSEGVWAGGRREIEKKGWGGGGSDGDWCKICFWYVLYPMYNPILIRLNTPPALPSLTFPFIVRPSFFL